MSSMGERFGKYELLQRIGMGGMAEVWVARTYGAQGFVKELVIKRILEQFNEDPDFVSMFINEARLASRLQHTNIVQIFDFDQVDGVYYIAMELVDGPDLRRVQATARRRELRMPQTLAVHVGVEGLKGLHYAHTRVERGRPLGIVHRDISPHNLLLSYAGEVKITDFGIAKVAALASATRTGMVKGKLTYMSPEQVRGDSIDARADIYALGIVLWELLTGRRLYEGVGSEGELVAAARRGAVPKLTEVASEVPPGLMAVVDRMLAAEADQRFTSAAEALAELSAFAGATDGLEVSDYLRRLLPAGAEREQRGLTAVDKPGSVAVAPPDAPTGTVEPPRAADVPAARAPAEESPQLPSKPKQARPSWVLPLLLSLCVGGGAAATTWATLRRAPALPAPDEALLTISSKPSGAMIEAQGIPLVGKGPHVVGGARGSTLTVVARWGARKIQREVVVGDQDRIEVVLPVAVKKPGPSDLGPAVDRSDVARDAGSGSSPTVVAATRADAALRRSERKAPHRKPLPRFVRAQPPRRTPPRQPKPAKITRLRPDAGHRRPTRTVERAFGRLRVIVAPWARVSIDGTRVGLTPIIDKPLRVGRHHVVLENPELAKKVKITVEIKKGSTVTLRRDW